MKVRGLSHMRCFVYAVSRTWGVSYMWCLVYAVSRICGVSYMRCLLYAVSLICGVPYMRCLVYAVSRICGLSYMRSLVYDTVAIKSRASLFLREIFTYRHFSDLEPLKLTQIYTCGSSDLPRILTTSTIDSQQENCGK